MITISLKKSSKLLSNTFKQVNLYVLSLNKLVAISSSTKFSRYCILFKQKKFAQNFFSIVKSFFKSIVKDVFDENDNFSKKTLNNNLFWSLISIDENNSLNFKMTSLKEFKNKSKITNAIIITRLTTLIEKSIKRSNNLKKITRKKS